MLKAMYARSKYRGRVEINPKRMREMLMAMVAGQAQRGVGATFLRVCDQDGEPVAFMAGLLQPVYFIGDRLSAEDAFLYAKLEARVGHTLRLIDAYAEWAAANPKVIEVKLSWVDTLPGAERVAEIYRRKGFSPIGGIFERRLDEQKEAAA